jgi:hypothetical protein
MFDDDPERRIYVLWAWHHRHLDVFDDADLIRPVREVLAPSRVVGDDGGHGAVKHLKGLGRVLVLNIQAKPRDVMTSVGATNDELRTARLLLPTRDVWTPRILEAARKLYEAEPDRLAAVESMLLNKPRPDIPVNTPADLAKELSQVIKSVNPRTKKFEINKRGKHGDASEAFRYMVSGFVRGPAEPEEAPITDPDALNEQRVLAYLQELERQKNRRRWE